MEEPQFRERANEDLFVERLAALPAKPWRQRRKDTSYALILRHYSSLKEAKGKGYSYGELAGLVESELGRRITPGTLRKYMNRAAKESAGDIPHRQDAAVIPPVRTVAPVDGGSPQERAKPVKRPRPTLRSLKTKGLADEDEFENL